MPVKEISLDDADIETKDLALSSKFRASNPSFKYGDDTVCGKMRHSLQLPYWIHVVLTKGHNWDWVFANNEGVEKFMKMFPEFCYEEKANNWRAANSGLFNTQFKAMKYLDNKWKKIQVVL